MENKKYLNIPEKIRVGFQKRTDSTDGNLSYIVYFDEKNVLRKEKSFENWRDNSIPVQDEKNSPINGVTIITTIKRNPYSSFGERVEKFRAYDPRGFEFEISVSNFNLLLAHGDFVNMVYTQECVYCWDRADLVLLPTNSVAYKDNVKTKKDVDNKVKAKALVIGETYYRKNSRSKFIYLKRGQIPPNCQGFFANKEKLIKCISECDFNQVRKNSYVDLHNNNFIFIEIMQHGSFYISSSKTLPSVFKKDEEISENLDIIEKILSCKVFTENADFETTLVKPKDEKTFYTYSSDDERFEYYARENRLGNIEFVVFDKKLKKWIENYEHDRENKKHLNDLAVAIETKKTDKLKIRKVMLFGKECNFNI